MSKKIQTATFRPLSVLIALIMVLGASLTVFAAPVLVVDDAGPDDLTGQKDLNFLTVDYSPGVGDIAVTWGWDDTQWSGANTGDACTLFDTDSDGFANYSLCITVEQAGSYLATRLYSCTADNRSDRCAGPTLVSTFASTGSASVEPADPFGTTGRQNNDCSAAPGCLTNDTVANLSVDIDDVGGGDAKLINVCSYPSQEPNSSPSDCVITPNNGFLTIVKVADPDDGTPFTLSLGSGQTSQDGTSSWTINGSGSVDIISFAPGTAYDLSEAVPSGWSLDTASCEIQTDPPASTGTFATPSVNDFEIRSGLETICTFNDIKSGTIIVEKQTEPDGATGSFTFTGDAAGTISDGGQLVVSGLAPGTYTSTENDPSPSFALTSIVCDDSNSSGTGNTVTFNLEAGETVKCTFTNTQQAAQLTLVKTVENNNGGTLGVSDFPLFISETPATSGTAYSLSAGTYTASETQQDGYTASDWGGDCEADGSITVAPGESYTCTITNDDQPGTLIVKKVVINNNGGTLDPEDFSFSVNGDSAVSFEADGQNDLTVDAGTYTVTEPAVVGYSTTYDNCTDVVVPNGGSATCTITNDDQQAYITVVKNVINDDGGSAEPDDFLLTLDGTAVNSGVAVPVSPGTYTAGETQLSGYTFEGFSGDCDVNGDVTVALGENKTCTLTNNDNAPSLTLIKDVINDNGGTAVAGDWTLTAAGYDPVSPDAGTYDLSESGPAGYTLTSLTCSNAVGQVTSVTLGLGEDVTCTFVNDDIQPQLNVIKHVINDNGGTATAADFTMEVSGNDVSPVNFAGSETGVNVFLDAGSYSVGETGVYGYSPSFSTDCTGSIAIGETKTCTITNDDIQPKLTLIKTVINDNGGTLEVADFSLFVDDTAVNSGETNGFNAGIYTASEIGQDGYAASDWGGDCAADGSVTLAIGDDKTCTITNDDIAPTLTIVKSVIGNDPPGAWSFTGSAPIDNFTLAAGGGTSTTYELTANQDFTVTEASVDTGDPSVKWILTGVSCNDGTTGSLTNRNVTVNMGLAEDVTCTFTNAKVSIDIVKTTFDVNGNEGDSIGVLAGDPVSWNYLVTNTGNLPLENVSVSDDQGVIVACPQNTLAVGESMICTASGIAAEGWYNNTGTASGDYIDDDGNTFTVTDSDDSSYFGVTPGVVTNSSLCDFGEQFRLIFTPDMGRYSSSTPYYKLSDSNPGQFFYNVFYTNDGSTDTITLEIPYPFVTQGANPVHVYGGFFVNESGDYNCFDPANELAAYGYTFGLGDYTDSNGDDKIGYGDVYLVEVPAELGFQYINIHLDYGLEKTDGWLKKGANATSDGTGKNPAPAGVSIVDNTAHIFNAYADGVLIPGSADTIYNLNEFKQIRGFGGLVQKIGSLDPVPGAQVQLIGPNGNVIETMTTDDDGWYLSNYVHKGKAADYTLKLVSTGEEIVVNVGGKVKFGEGNFLVP